MCIEIRFDSLIFAWCLVHFVQRVQHMQTHYVVPPADVTPRLQRSAARGSPALLQPQMKLANQPSLPARRRRYRCAGDQQTMLHPLLMSCYGGPTSGMP